MRRCLIVVFTLVLMGGELAAGDGKKDGQAGSGAEATKTQKTHQYLSADCFNKCWTLIDKTNRSPEDVEDMILLAHASLWHWKQRQDCKPVNLSIGYWQVSRVYALADEYEMARLFGEKCLKVGRGNQLPPFYLGYAYEALARAEALHNSARS